MSATFQRFQEIVKDNSKESIVENFDEIWELANEIDSVGTSVFSEKDGKYLMDFFSLIQSTSLCYFMVNGEINTPKILSIIGDDDISKYLYLTVKLAIGLAAMEELR